MKILLVVSSYLPNFGGLQTITSNLARGLYEDGEPVTVLTQRYPRYLPEREEIDAVPVRRFLFMEPRWRQLSQNRPDLFLAGLFYFPLTLFRLTQYLRKEHPDIVNLHFVGAPALFLLVAQRLLHFNYVVSLHGDDVEGLTRGTEFDRWIFEMTLRRAAAITACSHALLEQAVAAAPYMWDKAQVVHNGIEINSLVRSPNTINQNFSLLAVGRMVPKKGFDVLVHAVAICAKQGNFFDLNLVGDGPEREHLEEIVCELGVANLVHFHGALEHSTVLVQIEDCMAVVIPSRQEPFGMVALEALAYGKPVIATDVDGLREVLRDADQIMVPADNPQALADAIQMLQKRLEVNPEFGARNRFVVERFSQQRMVQAYKSLFLQIQEGC